MHENKKKIIIQGGIKNYAACSLYIFLSGATRSGSLHSTRLETTSVARGQVRCHGHGHGHGHNPFLDTW